MLPNPFTPSEIASSPDDFFGRSTERAELQRALQTGSAAIQGAIGIGKSSLLALTRLQSEGFGSFAKAASVIVTCHKDIRTIDQMAQLVLEELIEIDEKERSFTFKIGSLFETGSKEVYRNFVAGRHLAALQRLLSKESLKATLRDEEMLLIAIDEADKCPIPLAQVIRAVTNQAQQNGIKNIRFLLAGVAPYYDRMLAEDPGVARFVYRVISLDPMSDEDANDLLETKLMQVADDSVRTGDELTIDPSVIPRVRALAGGHPHLLQLLGSHLVEQEEEDPDGIIDARNLSGALTKICYDDRAQVYDSTLHMLQLENRLEPLLKLFEVGARQFPTRVNRYAAAGAIGSEALKWFVDHDILVIVDPDYYGLADEFLRVRLILDAEQSRDDRLRLESEILRTVPFGELAEVEQEREEEDEVGLSRMSSEDEEAYLRPVDDDEELQ